MRLKRGPDRTQVRVSNDASQSQGGRWLELSARGYDAVIALLDPSEAAEVAEALSPTPEAIVNPSYVTELEERVEELEQRLAAAEHYGDTQATLANSLRDVLQDAFARRTA